MSKELLFGRSESGMLFRSTGSTLPSGFDVISADEYNAALVEIGDDALDLTV